MYDEIASLRSPFEARNDVSNLIPPPLQDHIGVWQIVLPPGEDLHGAGFEFGDQRLRVERVVGE